MPVLGRDELWRILVETVHALPMYGNHRRYVEEIMIKETPEISSQELSVQLNITLGEAIVLLDEIRGKGAKSVTQSVAPNVTKTTDRSLLDFSAS